MNKIISLLLFLLFSLPVSAQTIIGYMTGAECRAQGGSADSTVSTPQDPDPVRACRKDFSNFSSNTGAASRGSRDSGNSSNNEWCPKGKTCYTHAK